MKQTGFDCEPADFFVAMNSIYSDYGKTLTKHGVTSPDAYAELAYDWVKDPDAYKDKAARYYEYIVK